MACGKPSGGFSHNPAEGYRIPHQQKITQNPCIQKKGLKFMTKGRITRKEQEYRISALLRFIFIFRYATREQLYEFAHKRLGLTYPRWLVDYSTNRGFITAYQEPDLGLKVYYLTQKGLGFIHRYEPFSNRYYFNRRHTGFNTFEHQRAVIESYYILYEQFAIKEWAPEWVIRKKFRLKSKIPDALIVLDSGIKIALEVETFYKRRDEWKVVVYKYKHEMPRYDAILIIAYSSSNYEGIRDRLFYIMPEFSQKVFMLTDLVLLKQGQCFYQGKVRQIRELIDLLKQLGKPEF